MYSLPSALAAYTYSNNLVTCKEEPTGLQNENSIVQDISIVPNPNAGVFTIKSEQVIEDLKIVNQWSELVLHNHPLQKEISCELEAGIYFVQIKVAKQSYVRKVIVQQQN